MKNNWSDLCEGNNCEKKDRCRRHTYALLAQARSARNYMHVYLFPALCFQTFTAAFIDLDDIEWATAPEWWHR